MSATASAMNEAMVQAPEQPQTPRQKLRRIAAPCSVCTTSGWNWMPWNPRAGMAIAACSVLSVSATRTAPGGSSATLSPWLIQTLSGDFTSAKSGFSATTRSSARPYSRALPRTTLPPSACTAICMP